MCKKRHFAVGLALGLGFSAASSPPRRRLYELSDRLCTACGFALLPPGMAMHLVSPGHREQPAVPVLTLSVPCVWSRLTPGLWPNHTSPCCSPTYCRALLLQPPLCPHLGPWRLPAHSLRIAVRSSLGPLPPMPEHTSSLRTSTCRLCRLGLLVAPLSREVLPRLLPLRSRLEPATNHTFPTHLGQRHAALSVSPFALIDAAGPYVLPTGGLLVGLVSIPPWAASDCYRSCCVVDASGIVASTAPSALYSCSLRWLRLHVPSLGVLRSRATADQTATPIRT